MASGETCTEPGGPHGHTSREVRGGRQPISVCLQREPDGIRLYREHGIGVAHQRWERAWTSRSPLRTFDCDGDIDVTIRFSLILAIVEAGDTSGTLIQARHALKQEEVVHSREQLPQPGGQVAVAFARIPRTAKEEYAMVALREITAQCQTWTGNRSLLVDSFMALPDVVQARHCDSSNCG